MLPEVVKLLHPGHFRFATCFSVALGAVAVEDGVGATDPSEDNGGPFLDVSEFLRVSYLNFTHCSLYRLARLAGSSITLPVSNAC